MICCYKCVSRCRTMTDKPFGVNLTILPALIPADYDGFDAHELAATHTAINIDAHMNIDNRAYLYRHCH